MSEQQKKTQAGMPRAKDLSTQDLFISKMDTVDACKAEDDDAPEYAQTMIIPKTSTESEASLESLQNQDESDDFESAELTQTLSSLIVSEEHISNESMLSVTMLSESDIIQEANQEADFELPARYELLGRLGEGGMGEVFAVKDRLLKRDVALKRVRGTYNDRVQKAFVREARILAQLTHPSIVPIHDLYIPQPDASHSESEQTSANSAYFTMEKIGGKTFSAYIKRFVESEPQEASMLLFQLLNIFVSIGEAIDYAHQQGVLHRDLKPDNLMVGDHGQIKVLDWGLGGQVAQQKEDSALNADLLKTFTTDKLQNERFTFTGTISGTPAYMSPEQARGETLSAQTDVYALGAILYEILSGEAPYVRAFKHDPKCAWLILDQAQRAKAPPPVRRELCPHPHLINGYLIKVCEKALEPNPAQRYASVDALLNDLRDYLSGESLRSRIIETKAKVKQLYTATTEQILAHQQAISLWERLQASNSVPLVAHFRSQVLHLLEELVRWDKSDIESRAWGLHLRYHYIRFQWWRGELKTGYLLTQQVLKDRCQKLEVFRESPLGELVPWSIVDCLKTQQNKVHLQFHFNSGDELKVSIQKTKRIDYEAQLASLSEAETEYSQDAKDLPYVHGQSLKLNLDWGHYTLKVKVRDKHIKYSFTRLIRVEPPLIPCFEGSELLTLEEYDQLAQSTIINSEINVEIHPPKAAEIFAQKRSRVSLSTRSLGAKLKLIKDEYSWPPQLEDDRFEWLDHHAVSIGTWQALPRTLASDHVECGGIWLQKNQVTIGAYLHYINDLDRLLKLLPQEEKVLPLRDLKQILPTMTLSFLEIKDQPLFVRTGVAGSFVLSPAMIAFGVTESVPMFQVSFADIERYLLWLSWETGLAWTIPSENEWELAARGIDQRTFPWGDLEPSKLTQMKRSSSSPFDGRTALTNGDPYLLARERRQELYPHDISPFGIQSLGGGMSDWTMKDSHKRKLRQKIREWALQKPSSKLSDLERARLLFNAEQWRTCFNEDFNFGERHANEEILRGGSYLNDHEQCTSMYRVETWLSKRFIDVSFRLAFEPEA